MKINSEAPLLVSWPLIGSHLNMLSNTANGTATGMSKPFLTVPVLRITRFLDFIYRPAF
jgi:hypothetical protein